MARSKSRPTFLEVDPDPGLEISTTNSSELDSFKVTSAKDMVNELQPTKYHYGLHTASASSSRPSSSHLSSRVSLLQITCPHCHLRIPSADVQRIREHVEACIRPASPGSDTASSVLSEPPESDYGDDYEDMPEPYIRGQFTTYPLKNSPDPEDDTEAESTSKTLKFHSVMPVEKFRKSLGDAEDVSYDDKFRRLENADAALLAWQQEYLRLDKYIKRLEGDKFESTREKNKENAATPLAGHVKKPYETGQQYQDLLESFLYGYEHSTHPSKLGQQDPINQRDLSNASGRHLRQRVPTKKATEAEHEGEVESDDTGVATRGRRSRADSAARFPSSRLGSEIPDVNHSHKANKFTSKAGKSKSRLAALQMDDAMSSRYSSTPEVSPTKSSFGPRLHERLVMSEVTDSENNGIVTDSAEDGFAEMSGPTRNASPSSTAYNQETDAERTSEDRDGDDVLSGEGRPGKSTSKAMQAGLSLPDRDDVNSKTNAKLTNYVELTPEQLAVKEKRAEEKRRAWETRRKNEAKKSRILPPSKAAPKQASKGKLDRPARSYIIDDQSTKSRPREERFPTSPPPILPPVGMLMNSKNLEASLKAKSKGKIDPDTGESKATKNMKERWRKKKEAEKLGLAPPKIGRYPKPKPGSEPSFSVDPPSLDGETYSPAPILPPKMMIFSSKNNGDKKRKQPDDRADATETDEPRELDVPSSDGEDLPPPARKPAGSRARKIIVKEEPTVPMPMTIQEYRPTTASEQSAQMEAVNAMSFDYVDNARSSGPSATSNGKAKAKAKPKAKAAPKPKVAPQVKPVISEMEMVASAAPTAPEATRKSTRVRKPTPNAMPSSRPTSSSGSLNGISELSTSAIPSAPILLPVPVTSGSSKRKAKPANLDGADDTSLDNEAIQPPGKKRCRDHPEPASPLIPTLPRKLSEYEEYLALSSPTNSTNAKRGRRVAALKARQSFNVEDPTPSAPDTEKAAQTSSGSSATAPAGTDGDIQSELNQQFASEYDHYQALASPESTLVMGKRKRRPVLNMQEIMRREAAGEDGKQ